MAEQRVDPKEEPSEEYPADGTFGAQPAAEERIGWWRVAIVIAVVAATLAIALQPRFALGLTPWLVILFSYLGLAAWSARVLHRKRRLLPLLQPKAGDTSIGIVLGLLLAGAGVVAQRTLAPVGSKGSLWLSQIYDRAGEYQTSGAMIAVLLLTVASEELVWRGLVLEEFMERKPRTAAAATAFAYALACSPSLFLLSHPLIGPNPFVVLAALGAGLVWAYARVFLGRLLPVFIAHLTFTYFMAAPLPQWF
jgi:membrane protease YdiL (CAAX protease family)